MMPILPDPDSDSDLQHWLPLILDAIIFLCSLKGTYIVNEKRKSSKVASVASSRF
jgi:hypothetical protein